VPLPTVLHRRFITPKVRLSLTQRWRRGITAAMGRIARCRQPIVAHCSIRILQLFGGDLRLHEAKRRDFASLQDCFTRELRPGARALDQRAEALVSPCDGEVMACDAVADGRLIQAKGLSYRLSELVGDPALAGRYNGGVFATLRLRPNMYHRFHAPEAGDLREIRHIGGDVHNVHPPTVRKLPRLYCRNTRAVLPLHIAGLDAPLLVVPVAALGVASLRIHGISGVLAPHEPGGRRLPCRGRFARGDELGYFLQGSTIVVIAPRGVALATDVTAGVTMRMGEALLKRCAQRPLSSLCH